MLPGPGRTSGNVDKAANRRSRRISRRSMEKKDPLDIQFERQVAEIESRHQEQRCAIFTVFPVDVFLALISSGPSLHVENGNNPIVSKSTPTIDDLEESVSSSSVCIHFEAPEESHRRCLINSSRLSAAKSLQLDTAPDSDFLVDTFTKTSGDAKRATRKKSKKKNKRHKKGHCRKVSDVSEMQCRQHKNTSPSTDVACGEALTLSPNHVADGLFEDTSSAGSEVQCRQGKSASPSIDVAGDEALTLSPNHVVSPGSELQCRQGKNASPSVNVSGCVPNHVADIVFTDTSSPGSSVREVSFETPDSENGNEYGGSLVASTSSASCIDEMELSRPTTSYFEFCEQSSSNNLRCLDSASNSTVTDSSMDGRYTDSSWNFSDDTDNLSIVRNECAWAPSKLTDSGGFNYSGNRNWPNKSNHGKNFCFQNGAGARSGAEEAQLCNDAGADGDFHLVVSKKRARKNTKMQLSESSNVEYMCNVKHGRNEKHAGCSSNRMAMELNTMDCSHRPSNVGMQPQHVVASKDFTKDFIHKPSKGRIWTPHEVTLKDYITRINSHCLSGPKENCRGKSQRYPSSSEVASSGFSEEQDADTIKRLAGIVLSRETDGCQMGLSSTSDLATQKAVEETCTSRGFLMKEEELQVLLPEVVDAIDTDSGLPSSGLTSSLDPLNNSSCVEPKVQNTASSRACSMQSDLHAQAAGSQSPTYASDHWNTSKPTESDSETGCRAVPTVEGNYDLNSRGFGSSSLHLFEMIKSANDAYEGQVASDVHLISGHPIADFETFIYSATPVIGQISCIRSGNCLQDQLVGNSPCEHQISNVSLRSVWEWYEEPGSYGLEVEVHRSLSSKRSTDSGSEFCAYFVPQLSAIQLFGQSRKDLDHNFGREKEAFLLPQPCNQNGAYLIEPPFFVQDDGELLFEYFESEQPYSRPPLFEKIKDLVSAVTLSDYQIFGDPKKLENVKLCELHPASWFCVAWYPICRIPHGNFRAAFLTYHSLGKLVPQTCSLGVAGGLTPVVSPVVGLSSYNDKGEQWFQLRDPEFKLTSPANASKTDRAEVLKERLRTLRRGASVMANAVIPKATGQSVNHHPDYEFFRSRS